MNALVTRLKELALRPLWTESDTLKARRRGRLLWTMPFVLLGGLIWGAFAAPTMGEGSPLFWSIIGATGFGTFFYVEQRLVPVVAEIANRVGLGALAALVWEVGVVGGLVYVLTSVLGAPLVPAVTLAIGVGVIYSLATEYLVLGSAADHMTILLGLGRGWSGARQSDYSYAEALEKRGDLEGASEIYKEAIWTNRRDPVPYLRLARVQARTGCHEQAIHVLREALGTARFSAQEEALAVREIHEISSTQLGDSRLAAPDLARYLERNPRGVHREWASRELAAIKHRIHEDR